MAAKKKTAKKRGSKKPSKTAFVLGFPHEMPAAEVVAKAKAASISLTDKYVYTIRSTHKTKGKAASKAKPGPKPGSKKASTNGAGTKSGSVEARFVDLALDVGLARAEELLARLRAKVKSIVL